MTKLYFFVQTWKVTFGTVFDSYPLIPLLKS